VTLPIQIGPSTVTINRDDRVLVCQPDARLDPAAEQGFFARDTRMVSGWELLINGRPPLLLSSSPVQFYSARFEFTNEAMFDDAGSLDRHSLSIRLDRTVAGGVHEDLDIVNFGRRAARLTIELAIASDFADLFDVRSGRLVRRGALNSRWFRSRRELRTTYTNRDFRRDLILRVDKADSPPQFANGRLIFVAVIPPKGTWHTCVRWLPLTGSNRRPTTLPCHMLTIPAEAPTEGPSVRATAKSTAVTTVIETAPAHLPNVGLTTSNRSVSRAWDQAVRDLESLRLEDPAFGRRVFIPAAGVPWFVTLFGRDSLVVSMQCISGYPEFAAGALRRLAQLQATGDDPERDMEPGKIPHEIRHGELAQLGILPYQPYYGTADATSLFVIVLSYLYQWAGDVELIRRFLPNAEAAMAWLDKFGDRDRDGLQEYATRSSHGYYNQGWKDAGDAIQHADGSLAPLPIALIELQGYAYDARLRMAAMLDRLDRPEDAERQRRQARRLYELVNDRLWWEAEGTYYLGLDGSKKPIASVASNPGHLLTSGIVPVERAGRLVKRLMEDDLWSGWGIRTLSTEHPGYNPFSYHTGSIWPHDNATIAGGFARYGYRDEAARIARATFDAAERFQANRVPELFSGLAREDGSFPVQYLGANVPQAWAAGAIIRLIAILAGIHGLTDADGSRLYVDPALPDWLPDVTISNLRAGRGAMTLEIHDGEVEVLENTTGFDVVRDAPPRGLPSIGLDAGSGRTKRASKALPSTRPSSKKPSSRPTRRGTADRT
jgi:glycogen debranching enzyme